MSGFGLYETLRILVPGATAAAIVAYVLRVAAGSGTGLTEGSFAAVIDVLDGANFLVIAIIAGFLLYLIDLPQRSRLALEGDPGNGVLLPSNVLRRLLENGTIPQDNVRGQGNWLSDRSLSLYFLLSDRHMPAEFHRRIYFFGSLYRIFADARYLAMAGASLGVPVALMVNGQSQLPFVELPYLAYVGLTLCVLLLVSLPGEQRHAGPSMRKAKREGNPQRYLVRLGLALWRISPVSLAILLLQAMGLLLAGQATDKWRATGLLVCVAATLLWLALELGPPPMTVERHQFRFRLLRLLAVPASAETQLTPAQRTLADLSLLTPTLMGGAVAAQEQGRSPVAVLLWGLLAVVSVTIMSVRKHEIRLINSLRDQEAWLMVNINNLDDFRTNAARRGHWI